MTAVTVAIDAGTTFIKAVALTEDGREIAVAARPTTVLHPAPDRSEQDMTEVREAVLDCISQVAAEVNLPVQRIVITAQGDGAWLVDERGEPLGNAMLWNDGRATDIVEQWTTEGILARAFRINGSLGNLGLPHSLLAWMRAHDSARLSGASSVLTCGGWLFLALTGRVGLHPSDASAPWLDISTGLISDELLELHGLDWARDLVPPVLEADQCTAPIRADLAQRMQVSPETTVTIAPYDVVTAGLGSGAVSVGDAYCVLGTTLCTGVLQDFPDTRGTPSGLTLLGGAEIPVVRAFPTLAGTGVVDWAVSLLGLRGPEELTELAAQSPPGANGVRVWPYLSPAGERAPFLDPAASGVIGGVSLSTNRSDLARAVIEGLAHVIRDCLAATGSAPTTLALSGGGAGSAFWCGIIADVTGVPTVRGDRSQVGARGALIAAMLADGRREAAGRVLTTSAGANTVIDPSDQDSALMDERHADFLATRDALSTRWATW